MHRADRFPGKLNAELLPLGSKQWPTSAVFRDSATPVGRDLDPSVLIAPPYDVLDEKGKSAFVAKHPNNIVSVDLPWLPPKTVGPDEVYINAHITLQSWLSAGVLMRDSAAGALSLHAELRPQWSNAPPPWVHRAGSAVAVRAGAGRPARKDVRRPDRRSAEADAGNEGAAFADLRALFRHTPRGEQTSSTGIWASRNWPARWTGFRTRSGA